MNTLRFEPDGDRINGFPQYSEQYVEVTDPLLLESETLRRKSPPKNTSLVISTL